MEYAHFFFKNSAYRKIGGHRGTIALYPLPHKGLSRISFGGTVDAVGGTVKDWKLKRSSNGQRRKI